MPDGLRGGDSISIVPLVFASLENAAPNTSASSILELAAMSLMWICATSFHDHIDPGLEPPSPMILVGLCGLSGLCMNSCMTLVTSSFRSNSVGFDIRNLEYFCEFVISFRNM